MANEHNRNSGLLCEHYKGLERIPNFIFLIGLFSLKHHERREGINN
jgi:hypothetical protein